jgi:hypothetical protein
MGITIKQARLIAGKTQQQVALRQSKKIKNKNKIGE